MKLNLYMEHKRFSGDETFSLIHQVFEAGKWLSIPDEIIEKLEVLDSAEDSEYAYLLLQIREKALNNLKSWKNISNLEDIEEFKIILQKAYLESNLIDDIQRIQILSALSGYYITNNDDEFFQNALNNFFMIQNIHFSNQIPRKCYNALNYIKNINENQHNELKMIRDNNGDIIKIFYKGNNLHNNFNTQASTLKALNTFQIDKVNFLNNYLFKNPLFCSFSGKEIENTISIKIKDKNLSLKLSLNNKTIFDIGSLDLNYFMRQIYYLLDTYREREQKRFDKNFMHKDYSIVINGDKPIEFILLWIKKQNDYAIVIKYGNVKTIKLDVIETISLFQEIFLHQTFYYSIKYNSCLKNEREFSNKEFLKIIGLKD